MDATERIAKIPVQQHVSKAILNYYYMKNDMPETAQVNDAMLWKWFQSTLNKDAKVGDSAKILSLLKKLFKDPKIRSLPGHVRTLYVQFEEFRTSHSSLSEFDGKHGKKFREELRKVLIPTIQHRT